MAMQLERSEPRWRDSVTTWGETRRRLYALCVMLCRVDISKRRHPPEMGVEEEDIAMGALRDGDLPLVAIGGVGDA